MGQSLFAAPKVHYAQGEPGTARSIEQARDSLDLTLAATSNEIEQADLLLKYSNDFKDIDHRFSLSCATNALDISQRISYQEGEMYAHYYLGQIFTNYNLDYFRALEHLMTALGIVRTTDERGLEITMLQLIGFIHNREGNVDKAVEFYQEGIRVARDQDDGDVISNLYYYIADIYEQAGRMDEAFENYEKVVEWESRNDFAETQPESLTALGRYYYLKEQPDNAFRFFDRAQKEFHEMGMFRWEAYVWSSIAYLRLQEGRDREALESALVGLRLAEEYDLEKEIADNHEALAVVYDSLGQYEKALYHFRTFTELQSAMYSLEKARQINAIQSSYDQMMVEQELVREREEKEAAKLRNRILLFGGGGMLILVTLLALRFRLAYRQKLSVNRELKDRVELKDLALEDIVRKLREEVEEHEKTQAKLTSTHDELNHFIYRSTHDLKGPLASIMGLVDIARTTQLESERDHYLELIETSSLRLASRLDVLIQVTKLSENSIQSSDFPLAEEVSDIERTLRIQGLGTGIALEVDAPEGFTFKTDRQMFRNVLTILLENSFQYHCSDRALPYVRISARRHSGGVRVSIADNGAGISEEDQKSVFRMFFRSQNLVESKGLGLYLVGKTIDKLKGTIHLDSQLGIGSTVTIDLPKS